MKRGQSLAVASGHPSRRRLRSPSRQSWSTRMPCPRSRKGHDTMCVVLTNRHKNLDTVRGPQAISRQVPSLLGFAAELRSRASGVGLKGGGAPVTTPCSFMYTPQ